MATLAETIAEVQVVYHHKHQNPHHCHWTTCFVTCTLIVASALILIQNYELSPHSPLLAYILRKWKTIKLKVEQFTFNYKSGKKSLLINLSKRLMFHWIMFCFLPSGMFEVISMVNFISILKISEDTQYMKECGNFPKSSSVPILSFLNSEFAPKYEKNWWEIRTNIKGILMRRGRGSGTKPNNPSRKNT